MEERVFNGASDELIDSCRRGDEKALLKLIATYEPFLRAICCKMTIDKELRKEIFQETVYRIIKGIGKFNNRCNISTWLYRITVNEAIRLIKRERVNWSTIAHNTSLDSIADSVNNTEKRIIRKDLFSRTMTLSSYLSKGHQEIIGLFYLAELSIEEISTLLKCNTGAVKVRLFKARKALADIVKKEGLWQN